MLRGKYNCIEKTIVKPVFKYTNLNFNEDVYDWSNYNFRFNEMRCDYQDTYIGFDIDLNKLFCKKYKDLYTDENNSDNKEFKFNRIHFSINHITKIEKSSNEPTLIFYHKIIIRVELRGCFCKYFLFNHSFSFDFNIVIERLKYDYKHAIEDMVGYVFREFEKHCEFNTENVEFYKYVDGRN